jgi:histidinol-phosphate aminotransferase
MSSNYWSKLVQQLEPYEPGEQPKVQGLIKLNTNENPYPPSPQAVAAVTALQLQRLRLYPDPTAASLKVALAHHFGLSEQQIAVGNGSDEILAFAFQAFFKGEKPILLPDITYGFYPVYCSLFEIDYRQIALDDNFEMQRLDYRQDNGGIVFPNPNAPTGIALGLDTIEQLLVDNPRSVVLVDEAYVDFGAESASVLIDRYPNLLVVQTLSKSRSLAGIRVGFALGHADLIAAMERVRNSFNPYSIDRIAELIATAAIEDVDYFKECCTKIIASREWTVKQLEALGFTVLPSKTNFIMVKPQAIDAATLFARLRARNILVRYFKQPRIDTFLRISIGTDDQMRALVAAVHEILATG